MAVPSKVSRPKRQHYQSPLSTIEFDAASDVAAYAEKLRQLGRTEQLELHTAADELEALLTNSVGSFMERMTAKRKAKKVARHLRKAADHAKGMAVEAVQLRKAFMGEYSIMLNPPRKSSKKVLNWKE